ncbi:MAG: heterodisulfide reductase subunit B, partial [Gaiellales bacterium]
SPAPHHLGGLLGVLLPARVLHNAARYHDAVVAPCAGCYNRLRYSRGMLRRDKSLRDRMETVLGQPPRHDIEVFDVLDFFNREIDYEEMALRSHGRLCGVKFATYYGCMLTRPPEVIPRPDSKDPVSMEMLLRATGAEVPFFPLKTECCGSYLGLGAKEIVMSASRRILELAAADGYDAIVTACPLCQQNLDLRQAQINRKFGTSFRMPVLYFSQVIGLGIGLSAGELGLDANIVAPPVDDWLTHDAEPLKEVEVP